MNSSCLIRTVAGKKVKRCSGCKQDLDLEAFPRGTGPGGFSRHCRECHRTWRQKHPIKRKRQAVYFGERNVVEGVEISLGSAPHWLSPLLDRSGHR